MAVALRRSTVALALCALASCQDYNFNPVGKCIIQPGSDRIKLLGSATADVLFVVDDSGSMTAEQASLARNFGKFIDGVAQLQADRAKDGIDPFEFHIAVTSTSIFEAWVPTNPPTCSNTPLTCNVQTDHYGALAQSVACSTQGAPCDDLIRNYWFQSTTPGLTFCPSSAAGVGVPGAAYPAGDFVAASGNPKVLHFTNDLEWSTWGTVSPDPKITTLVEQFKANITVGTCGSGMEQHLEAGRLAVKKALQQDGLKQVAGVDPKEWPHDGAKMVVVWVGDEDDCSNPNDPTKSLAFTSATSGPGSDVCTEDDASPLADQKKFPVSDYAAFFTNLDRPFGAAFIYSADPDSCQDDGNGNIVCTPGKCTCECPASCLTGPGAGGCSAPTATPECLIPADCAGRSAGSRLHDLSQQVRAKGAATLDASVCDADFGQTLQRIADLVKPPAGLTLPTKPASSQVAVLRIESADGSTSRFCDGPGADRDWNFVDCDTGAAASGETSLCITINHSTGHCEANPGETYVAQYLGLVPQPSASNLEGGCATVSDCTRELGGAETDWTCAPVGSRGTCVCAQ
ncbi:MAG: hypothetical protein A2V77_02520 [Anaeromyxobacter sp. RBG_16_69_14]|nr:MAG: hypothetical protein A2V77_02520 [Anaeromyxobacter sp. RBG_16_69_14]